MYRISSLYLWLLPTILFCAGHQDNGTSIAERFTDSIYWCVATLTSTGYGDIHAQSDSEMGKITILHYKVKANRSIDSNIIGQCLSRNTYNFGIGNSICKHCLKFCGSLLDYLGGAMINLCGSLLPDRAWRCCNFSDQFSSVQSLWCCTGLVYFYNPCVIS